MFTTLIKRIPSNIINQLLRYGVTGLTATIVHFSCVIVLVHFFHFHPLLANLFAFIIGFHVSFSGNYFWTFPHPKQKTAVFSLLRYFTIAVTSFTINESLYYGFLTHTHLQYQIALIFVLVITPPINFILSRIWAFK